MTGNYFFGFGNRKESIAKVRICDGSGKIAIVTGNVENRRERDAKEYFCSDFLIESFLSPLDVVGKLKKVDLTIFVKGGGISAQAGAIRLGIARALIEMNPEFKHILKTYRLLSQDKRFKERKKVGKRGARRSPQFTKR